MFPYTTAAPAVKAIACLCWVSSSCGAAMLRKPCRICSSIYLPATWSNLTNKPSCIWCPAGQPVNNLSSCSACVSAVSQVTGCGDGVTCHVRTFLHAGTRITLSIATLPAGEALPGEDRGQVCCHTQCVLAYLHQLLEASYVPIGLLVRPWACTAEVMTKTLSRLSARITTTAGAL